MRAFVLDYSMDKKTVRIDDGSRIYVCVAVDGIEAPEMSMVYLQERGGIVWSFEDKAVAVIKSSWQKGGRASA